MSDSIEDIAVITHRNVSEKNIPLLIGRSFDDIIIFLPSIRGDVDIERLADEVDFSSRNNRTGVVMDLECNLTYCCGGHFGGKINRSGRPVVGKIELDYIGPESNIRRWIHEELANDLLLRTNLTDGAIQDCNPGIEYWIVYFQRSIGRRGVALVGDGD